MSTASTSTTCAACGASGAVDGVCGRCGFSAGDAHRCPHCSAAARVEPKGAGAHLRWICGVCGGPRTPSDLGGAKAATKLREARASERAALRSRAAFWFFTAATLLFTLIALAAWPAALVVKLVLLAMAVTPATLAVRARAGASAATVDATTALDGAWLAAAEEVASTATKGVTVDELAARLKVDPTRAEALLTQLAVLDRTRIDVDDDAAIRYSVAPEVSTKVRIGGSEEAFLALEEAERIALEDDPSQKGARRLTADEQALEQAKLATAPFGRGRAR